MNCGYKEKTILYFYGELPGGAELEAHIGSCAECLADLAVLKSLSAGFSAFRPEPPVLHILESVKAIGCVTSAERFMAGFRRFVMAGVATAAFLLAFQTLSPRGGTAGWGGPDSRLDSVEYDIYSLQDDMVYSSSADFDYGYADIENRKEQAAGKAA